jgi:hypothetical protein
MYSYDLNGSADEMVNCWCVLCYADCFLEEDL